MTLVRVARVRSDPLTTGCDAAHGVPDRRFRFVDLFAGIGGIRAGLEAAGGECVLSVERDPYARRTYEHNWGDVGPDEVRTLLRECVPTHEILAAGFPCQPFSLAGVSKKQSMGRAHGFADPGSGNLFFQIVRLIGGPWDLGPDEIEDEATAPDDPSDHRFLVGTKVDPASPPVLLLENVRHLLSHDHGRTYRVIKHRLMRSGYLVSRQVINGAAWVPQNRRRTIIVGVRHDLFDHGFAFPEPPEAQGGPKLSPSFFSSDPYETERYRITEGVWSALKRHRTRHEDSGNGFGYGLARMGSVTRTLSARYYKDGGEILVPMPDGSEPPRRLTPQECARLMGFPDWFSIPPDVSDTQAYRQFGNSVVVPQFRWLADALGTFAEPVFASRRREALGGEVSPA